jgi:NDP-hexose-3-ketoreductase
LKVLLIGYSKIARRRIINFFLKKKIEFCVATISTNKKVNGAYHQYNNYDEALKESGADIVYISLPNSLHYNWALKSLRAGYHVIVDKPLCEKKAELKKLFFYAKKNKKLIVESNFFNYHNQITYTKKLIGNLSKIINIHANFIIPYPPKKNILISKKLNGGALMDMGPYAAAISRIFIKEKIRSKKVILQKNKYNLITGFDLICEYDSKTYTGCFKFGGEYHNELFVHTRQKSIKIDRVFSPPSDKQLIMLIKKGGVKIKHKIKKDDVFQNFYLQVVQKIKNKDYLYYTSQLKADLDFRNNVLKN